mgnify:CR=1 FL=1
MTEDRLYYTDAYLMEFDAVVRDVARKDDRWSVVLDRTAFYPTSGGQPFDTGTIGEANVLDVFGDEAGNVTHLIDRELGQNSRVRGHIDWDRRFDHMQQHTGQHLLSAAFERVADDIEHRSAQRLQRRQNPQYCPHPAPERHLARTAIGAL